MAQNVPLPSSIGHGYTHFGKSNNAYAYSFGIGESFQKCILVTNLP